MTHVIGWIDYDNFNFATADGTEEEINAVAQDIRNNGYKFGGDDHENYSNCCPLLSNGKALRLSWRNWGYVMAVAYDLKTNDGNYNYILWYMGEYGPSAKVLPKATPIDFTNRPKGKTFVYELSEDEYHSVFDASFTCLFLPVDFYDTISLKAFDEIVFKYKDSVLLETVVNDVRFAYYTIDELFTKDDILDSYPADSSNLRDLNPTKTTQLVKTKYGIDNDKMILICFDITSDLRSADEIYV